MQCVSERERLSYFWLLGKNTRTLVLVEFTMERCYYSTLCDTPSTTVER